VEFSRRERAAGHLQKTTDLVREAVGWNDVFGDPVAIARIATRMSRPHLHRTTPAQRAFWWNQAHWGSRLHNELRSGITRSTELRAA
jgi:hypothetical protein